MKGYRFYLEFPDAQSKRAHSSKRGGGSEGNVFALCLDSPPRMDANALGGWVQEGVGAVHYQSNSPVCGSSTSLRRLQLFCKRISEAVAREIHPALFEYLGNAGNNYNENNQNNEKEQLEENGKTKNG